MSQRGQMLNRLPDPVQIVNPNVDDAWRVRSYIHKHQRNLTETKMIQQRVFHAKRQNGYPVNPAFDHSPYRRFHSLRIVHRRRQQYFVIIFNREILKCLHDLRKKWIGDFRNDQPKNPASSRNQSSCLRIRIVTKLVDDLPNPLGQLRINRRYTINRPGYGGSRNLRSSRDFTNIHGYFAGKRPTTTMQFNIRPASRIPIAHHRRDAVIPYLSSRPEHTRNQAQLRDLAFPTSRDHPGCVSIDTDRPPFRIRLPSCGILKTEFTTTKKILDRDSTYLYGKQVGKRLLYFNLSLPVKGSMPGPINPRRSLFLFPNHRRQTAGERKTTTKDEQRTTTN